MKWSRAFTELVLYFA